MFYFMFYVMTCERCVEIFLKAVMFDKNLTLIYIYLVKTYSYTMIFILVYAKSFKSIAMLAYRVSFCYAVNLKFCSDAFINLFSPSFLQHGCMLKS